MLEILIALIVAGAILYIVQIAPIDATLKQIAKVIVIVFLLIWALRLIASLGIPGFNVPGFR